MSVRNAGATIKEIRIKNGLSQEQLSEGICSALSISRIENNLAGISPSTFQALMERCGVFCELIPAFANRCDFDCFYSLKKAKCYVENWQFDEAIKELTMVEDKNWANNKLYYQEWFLYTYYINSRINDRSYKEQVLDTLKISQSQIKWNDFSDCYFSSVELELLISLCDEHLKLSEIDLAKHLLQEITTYLSNSKMASAEKEYYEIKLQIVYSKLNIQEKEFDNALKYCETAKSNAIRTNSLYFLYEINFLTALGYYYQNDIYKCLDYFKYTFYSSLAIDSVYCEYIVKYFQNTLSVTLPDSIIKISLPKKNCSEYEWKKKIIPEGDGTYEYFSEGVLHIGTLIKELRIEKNISATRLCKGLCNNSKLSKIESLELQPSIDLTRALLQRLGISDRIFVFWGNSLEFDMDEIRTKLLVCKDPDERQDIIEKTRLLIDKKDVINQQFFLLNIALTEQDIDKRLDILNQALALTIPDFNINNITNYRLSFNELSILNNIARSFVDSSNTYKSLLYYNQILEYFKYNEYDNLLKSVVLSITVGGFARSLVIQMYYEELHKVLDYTKQNFMRNNINQMGSFYFFYCQAMCCEKNDLQARFYANLAYQINHLTGRSNNAESLKEYLLDEFGLSF